MSQRFVLQISMLSDWHIGTGASGEGKIDSSIARDEETLPYLPAKTLNGVIRDACEELLDWLGHDSDPEMDNWATFIFGRANRSAKIHIRSGRMDEETRSYLAAFESHNRQYVTQNLATVKAGVSIDQRSGRAKDDHLSFTEVARPMVLTADIEIHHSSPDVLALIASACHIVEYVGGKRRRGLGRCEMKLLTLGGEEVLSGESGQILRDRLSALPRVPDAEESITTETREVKAQESAALTLTVTALSPLLFPIDRKGNVVTSSDYIPGTALLPLIHEVVQRAGFDAQVLIRSGQIRTGRGFPHFFGQTMLPTPFALSTPKGSTGRFVNNTKEVDSGVVTKQLRRGWVALDSSGSIRLHRVPFISRTHNSVADDLQRPTSETGGVFTYEAIAPGQQFRSTIILPSEVADVLFSASSGESELPKRGAIGTSRKDDYGNVALHWERATTSVGESNSDSNFVSIWCVSDVLFRKIPGVGLAESVAQTIAKVIDVPMNEVVIDETSTRMRPVRIDSWHARWGLPRTSLFGIAAGSCVTVRTATAEQSESFVTKLTGAVIGLRQAEGFGAITVNHPLLQKPEGALIEKTGQPRASKLSDLPSSSALQRAVIASVRDVIRRRAGEIARQETSELPKWWSPSSGGKSDGQNHQFALLRRYAMQPLLPLQENAKEQFMHDLDAWSKQNREAAWELLSNPDSVWKILGDFEHPLGVGAQDIPHVLRNDLWLEAMRSLVEHIHRRRTRSAR
jgi:CRISPR-associated protein Csx10